MKKTGKLFKSEKTVLDQNSATDNILNKTNDIESKESFSSIRANNCLISGKWVYEVQIHSHKLAQIGWVIYINKVSNLDSFQAKQWCRR
jgi:hypothetical protein